jgi:hypothetical protein
MIWKEVFLQSLQVNCDRSSFWILHDGGITYQRRYVNIKPVRVHMSMEPYSIVVSVNLVALSWFLSCPGLNLAEILFSSFALVG